MHGQKNRFKIDKELLINVFETSFVFILNYFASMIIFSVFGSIFKSPIIGICSIGLYFYIVSLFQNYFIFIDLKEKKEKITKSDLRELRLEEILKKKNDR